MTNPLADLEAVLLGGRPRYTRAQAAARAGLPVEEADQIWTALGFATVADDEIAFTDTDVEALRQANGLVGLGLIEAGALRTVTRMVGQSMSRLADWQSRLVLETVANRPEVLGQDGLPEFVGQLVPVLERVHAHVWRRQLAASAQRLLSGDAEQAEGPQTVGFADLAGYTSLTRQLAVTELAVVLEEFETLASDLIAEHRGRVIKTIGDEVLFVVEKPAAAAELALSLQERIAAADRLPPLRIGLALGEVLDRYGDVFGPVVNIASRLTGVARPGTVLIDHELAQALRGDDAFSLQRIRTTSVRGYQHLTPYRLRRG
ncbi:MAG TPA: adenylate/guanylate cyclase domain-containing protein [Jatrophihabitans sp.]|nr:adenylate/guanylate cyclase domain-containing protein [Jatrophihabitans sp.]